MVIYKYELGANCKIPKSAKILTLATEKNTPCIWALVDPKSQEAEIKDIIQLSFYNQGGDIGGRKDIWSRI